MSVQKEKKSFKDIFVSALNAVKDFFIKLAKGVWSFVKKICVGFVMFFVNIYLAFRDHPKAALRGLGSAIIPGYGQFRNKQWYKAIPFLAIFVIFITIEISTSSYIYAMSGEIGDFPAADGVFYFFRDYGGFFTKGIWGFFSLGELVLGDMYRGEQIVIFDQIFTWKSADNSQVLLGEGIIALVMVSMYITIWAINIRDAYKSYLFTEENEYVETASEYFSRIWDEFFAYIIIIPSFTLILFFTVIPFLFSFLVAFTNWTTKVALGQQLFRWDGFSTFIEVFTNSDWLGFFGDVLLWTIFYAFMSSVTVYILGLIQALIIESKYVRFKKVWRIILILPWAIPGMISLMLFRNVFADNFGLMNQVLNNFGITESVKEVLRMLNLVNQVDAVPGTGNILWLNEPANGNLAKTIIIVVNLWLGYPYFMMLITGVLGTIPGSLYEAADIDGASSSQKFRYITLPWVLRATAPVIITTFTFNFNNFGAIYFLSGGGPGYPIDQIPLAVRVASAAPGQTDILISWIYKLSFTSGVRQYNLASVYSILIFIFISLTAIYNLSKLKSFWEED